MRRKLTIVGTCLVVGAFAGSVVAAPDGKALYSSKCAMCHGQDGVPKKMGEGSKAFGDPEFKKGATVESIVKATHEGVGKMKPMKSVSDEDAKAIAEYILTLGSKN